MCMPMYMCTCIHMLHVHAHVCARMGIYVRIRMGVGIYVRISMGMDINMCIRMGMVRLSLALRLRY